MPRTDVIALSPISLVTTLLFETPVLQANPINVKSCEVAAKGIQGHQIVLQGSVL